MVLPEKMKRKIVDFDTDDENHWRAELECGHYQHMRHDPPLRNREWVLDPDERTNRIGVEIDCLKCDLPEDSDGA